MSLGTDHMFDDDVRDEGAGEADMTEEDEELEEETDDEAAPSDTDKEE